MRRICVLVIALLGLVGCATQELKTSKQQKCGNPNQCTIQIVEPKCGLFSCTASVDYELTIFEKGKNNFKVTWVLPEGYGFCDTAGDGVWLKEVDPYEQYESPHADKPSGRGPCKFKEFQLRAKNTRSLPNEYYYYMIQFRSEDGKKRYFIDPRMMNE